MPKVSEDLARFQIALQEGQVAQVTPKVATEVFSSISYLDDITPTAMARKMKTTKNSACAWVRDLRTPNFNRFVHLMDRLGYDVMIQKKVDPSI